MIKKLVSFSIFLFFAFNSFNYSTLAKTDSLKSDNLQSQQSMDDPIILKEVIEGRGLNSKRFLLSDGSYKIEIHGEAIHYKDENGKYQDIHTDLVDEINIPGSNAPISKEAASKRNRIASLKSNKSTSSFTSFQSPFYSQIPKKIVTGYSIENEGERLSIIPQGASVSSIGQIDSEVKSRIKYPNVWLDTDVELQIVNDGIKENIILKNANSPHSISFEVQGDINGSHLQLQAPWIRDANGEFRNVKMIERTEGNKKYIDYEWNTEGMAYPAVIDPTISISPIIIQCSNQYYSSGNCPSNLLQLAYKHQIGTDMVYGDTFRSFLKFSFPSYSNLTYTKATLLLRQYPSTSYQGSGAPTFSIKPYALGREILSPGIVTWSGGPLGPEVLSNEYEVPLYNAGAARSAEFDVTGIMNYYINKQSASMAVALIATGLSIPPTLPNKEYFIEFFDPVLTLYAKDWSAPNNPIDLKITGVTNNSVSLSWQSAIDNFNSVSQPVYYQVLVNGVVNTTYYTNSYTVSGLTPNIPYTFSIRALDTSSNYSTDSNPVMATPGSMSPIAFFRNLSGFQDYTNPYVIKWSYYDPLGRTLTAYEIKGSTDNWATTKFDTGAVATTVPVDYSATLSPSIAWSLAIRVNTGSGMGAWSYINNIRIVGNTHYFYDSRGRIDYVLIDNQYKIKYVYDKNGNLIQTVKTSL